MWVILFSWLKEKVKDNKLTSFSFCVNLIQRKKRDITG